MNLLTKISEALANRGLTVISESRLRPAVITFMTANMKNVENIQWTCHSVVHAFVDCGGQVLKQA
jgi:hypothetical protein